jgi:Arc/MetJ-type ribon-helix-helix transcriptional regulator
MTLSHRIVINLTPRQAQVLEKLVESGKYGNKNEIVRELIRERFMREGVKDA